MPNKILITGHPRSGTMYIYKILEALNQPVLFEKESPRFTISWKHAQPGVFVNYRGESQQINHNFDLILHQVRHPLKVIASATTLWNSSMAYIAKFVNLPDPLNHRNQTILNCMYSYYYWNRLIEKNANWRYRIENFSYFYRIWCNYLNIPYKPLPQIPKTNTRNHLELSWNNLYKEHKGLACEIKIMAKRYGYE